MWAPRWRRRLESGNADGRALSASFEEGVKGSLWSRPGSVDAASPGCQIAGMPSGDPIAIFQRHLRRARRDAPAEDESDAAALSTVGRGGRPRSRMVLLRGADRRGFVFFTNLRSDKGREIARSDRVALCVYWPRMKVQIRIEGRATLVSDREADAYFATRHRDSQVAAWTSAQSRPISGRAELIRRFRIQQKRFEGTPVPRPPHWSGFRVAPDLIEFWYGRPHRLHDRRLFTRRGNRWIETILSP
jgi:pyridoxamine 5'-phosphate oxidase